MESLKASELVAHLQKFIDQHGDGDVQMMVEYDKDHFMYSPLYQVKHESCCLFPFLLSGEVHCDT